VKTKIATCKICGWHGEILRHKPAQCANYVQIKNLYLTGLSSREIGRRLGIDFERVLYALKAARVKTRSPGGLNNPHGYNGRMPRPTL